MSASLCNLVVNLPTLNSHKPSLLLHATTTQPQQFLASPNTILKRCNGSSSSWKLSRTMKTAVAAVDSSDPAAKQETERKKYYFLVANAKFMLDDEEHFQEQLFERLRLFGERNMEQDFWLVIEPKFLDKFPNITKRLKRPAVALVSTNGPWITFMKLRLDRVLLESYEADSLEEALACTPVNLEFEKPEKWVAPYPKYESGWWEPFLPPGSQTSKLIYFLRIVAVASYLRHPTKFLRQEKLVEFRSRYMPLCNSSPLTASNIQPQFSANTSAIAGSTVLTFLSTSNENSQDTMFLQSESDFNSETYLREIRVQS